MGPLDFVRYDSDNHPDTRTLHTSLLEKMKDAFYVWRGDTGLDGQIGIYDLLMLNTVRMLGWLFEASVYAKNYTQEAQTTSKNNLAKKAFGFLNFLTFFPTLITGGLYFLLDHVVRRLVAVVGAVISSPIVALVHVAQKAFGFFWGNHLAKKVFIFNVQSNPRESLVTLDEESRYTTPSSTPGPTPRVSMAPATLSTRTLLTSLRSAHASLSSVKFTRQGGDTYQVETVKGGAILLDSVQIEDALLPKLAMINPSLREIHLLKRRKESLPKENPSERQEAVRIHMEPRHRHPKFSLRGQ